MLKLVFLSAFLVLSFPCFAVIPVEMDIAGLIDNSPAGPVNRPTTIKSLEQFKKIFIGTNTKAALKNRAYLQVKQYFLNGGKVLKFNRVLGKDFVGNESQRTGIYAFSEESNVRTLVIPGLTTLPLTVMKFVQLRKMIFVLDAPSLNFKKLLAWRDRNLAVEAAYRRHIVVYYNRILVDGVYLGASGSMAGIFAKTNVWRAPANHQIIGASKVEVEIDSDQQRELGQPKHGLSINVIRNFPELGILVWGARTLDGNSSEWRYISSNRLQIQIEETILSALSAYSFESNNGNTWLTVKTSISNYLFTLWREGALPGASPDEAFAVEVGLGTTMTPEDVLNKLMIVQVTVALNSSSDFIVMMFQQEVDQR